MRVRETLQILGGSILVYAAVATCTAARGGGTAARDAGRVDVSPANSPDVSAPGGPDVSTPAGLDVSTPGGFDVSRVLDVLTNPVPDARADPQSGSRLKAIYYLGADGSKLQLAQWYDSQRGENCMFGMAADGNYRCLPSSAAYPASLFADAGCTQPLVEAYSGPGCAAPTSARAPSVSTGVSTGCAATPGSPVYQIGSLFTGTPYSGTPSSCNKATAPSGYALYSLGAEIPASSFVSATIQTDQ
jgi:hypothetical protein